jgi:hypothetical protein
MIAKMTPRAASSQTWRRGSVLMTCVIDWRGLNHVVSQGEAAGASCKVMADTALPRRPIARPAVSVPTLAHAMAADNRHGLTPKEEAFACAYVAGPRKGDHALVLGKVIDGRLLDAKAQPMTYRETGMV